MSDRSRPLLPRLAAALTLSALLATACSSPEVSGTADGAAHADVDDPAPEAGDGDRTPGTGSEDPAPAEPTDVQTIASDLAFIRDVRDEMHDFPAEWPIVRGVYSTMHSLWGERWEYMLDLVRTTEINAIVIDVKDDKGQLAWDMDLPLAIDGGGADWKPGSDPRERIRELRQAGGYPIARVVCFKDSKVALSHPELAVVDTRTGQPWQGRDGQHWLNPYEDEAWQWCIDVGKEAAKVGFLEVQFDYVRFPNGGDGPSKYFDFPGRPADAPREVWRHPDEITEFLTAAREQLHAAGVRVSADIFGLTTYNWSWDGDGTGQVFERLAEQLDYVSPMVYPSHYGPGNYGLKPHPVDFPYETVWNAMQESRMRSQGLRAKIRPWLEDFAPTWLGRGHSPERVRQQIQAVYDNGIEGWLLWNAGNSFSTEAVGPNPAVSHGKDIVVPPRTRDPAVAPGAEPRTWPGHAEDGEAESALIGEGNAAGTQQSGAAEGEPDGA
jgi:hypothetical protein